MTTKQFYKTIAWRYFSRWILLYYSKDGLFVKCYTCGKILQLNSKICHCGHYIKVSDSQAVALEFTNVLPQCYQDNRYYGGKPEIMEKRLIEIHGQKAIDELNIKKWNECKLDIFTMNYFKEIYKHKFDEIVKIKGNPWK